MFNLSSTAKDAYNVDLVGGRRVAGLENFHINVFCGFRSRATFFGTKLNNAIEFGIRMQGGSAVNASNVEVKGAGINSVFANGVSASFTCSSTTAIDADQLVAGHYDCDFRKTPGVDSTSDIVLGGGANAFISQAITPILGGVNIPPNSWLREGFLTDNRNFSAAPRIRGVIEAQPYTVGTVPSASANTGAQIYVSNGAAGLPIMAFSDGTNWLRCDTRTAIS
jgi:hypothetical protein